MANVASNLAFFSRAAPLASLPAPHPAKPVGAFDPTSTYVAIINSDGDNIAFDEVRISVGGEDGHAQVSTDINVSIYLFIIIYIILYKYIIYYIVLVIQH